LYAAGASQLPWQHWTTFFGMRMALLSIVRFAGRVRATTTVRWSTRVILTITAGSFKPRPSMSIAGTLAND
jgi:hypothetical protein